MKDKTLLPDMLLSIAISITLMCVLRDTVVVIFPLWAVIAFVTLWHIILAVIDRLRPSAMAVGTILFILTALLILYAARIGAAGTEEGWLGGFLRWATEEGVEHNDAIYRSYRMVTLGAVSFAFSLAMFLLIRCEAHVGLLMMVGVAIFLGMQWTGFVYAPILLWLFLFLILSAALRQGLWKGGQQGIQMLCAAPLCVLILLAVSAFPLDDGPLGQRIIDRFNLFSEVESPIDWGPFAFFQVGQRGGDASDLGRDLGGPFQPDNRTMLYLKADKPLYLRARSAREYTGRRWDNEEQWKYAFSDTMFLTGYPHYVASFMNGGGNTDLSPEVLIRTERYQMPAMLYDRLGGGSRSNRRWYTLRRATVYYWDMSTTSVFTPDGFLRFNQSPEEIRQNPFSITRDQTVTAAETMRLDDAYSLYYLDYNLTASEWNAILDLSYRGFASNLGNEPAGFDGPGLVESIKEFMISQGVSGETILDYSVYEAANWHTRSAAALSRDAYSRYLQLPNTLPERVYALAQEITKDAQTTHQKAKAIEKYLAETYPYSTNVPETPPGADFVDYFLFDLRRGYCTYYATAMVVLCRALDIPARYVEGFAFAPEMIQGYYYATGAQAHAWPEVYLDGFGWISYEPTAGFGAEFEGSYRDGTPSYTASERPIEEEPELTPEPTSAPYSFVPATAEPDPTAWEVFADVMGAIGRFLLRWLWVIVVLLWFFFNHIRHKRFLFWLRKAAYGKAGMRRVYRRAARMLALLGLAPEPPETPLEMALRVHQVIRDDGSLLTMAEAYSYAVYGGQFPSDSDRKAAADALGYIEEAVRRRALVRLWLLRYGLGLV